MERPEGRTATGSPAQAGTGSAARPDGRPPLVTACLLSTVFATLALTSLVGVLRGDVDTGDLNRPPRPWPAGEPWLAAERWHGTADFLADRVALRRSARELRGALAERTGAGIDDVVVGSAGWLYLLPTIEPPGPSWEARRPAQAGRRAVERLEESGRRARFALAPDKATVVPVPLPPWARRLAAADRGRLDDVRTLLGDRLGPRFLDVLPELEELAAADPSSFYLRRDTHWTERAAAVTARRLVESFGGRWEPGELERRPDVERRNDLQGMLGLDGAGTAPHWTARRGGIEVRTTHDADGWSRTEAAGAAGESLLPPLLVLHDSFGNALRVLLPPYFRSVTFVPFGTQPDEALRIAVAESELVLVQVVEREALSLTGRHPLPAWETTRLLLRPLEPR